MLLIFKCAFFSGLLLRAVDCAPFPEYVVYPKLLEARGLNAEKMLYIQEDIILRLEKSSVLADNLLFREIIDGKTVDTLMDGKKLEAKLYHDRNQMASVAIEDKNGAVEVKGIVNDELRIAPLRVTARSENEPTPHKIYKVTSRSDKKNKYKAGPGAETNGNYFFLRN
uniref:Putative tick metalloprotease n=1 Tax=Ixodes ricinus TaxID=34613 RepID=V5HCA2_IXORI